VTDAYRGSATGTSAGLDRWAWPIALGAIVVLAAILRFVALPTRGTWDADQGHDMLVLTRFVNDGVWPLLGPPTSIGDFHHGALYYYLLAPAAWLGGGDPTIVVAEIALLGTIAVGLVASVARSAAGIAAGVVAGLLMAVSATAIDESTFLWNPNLVAFTSALAVAAAWRAWTTRHARWWLLVAAAQAATMQCHVLGVVLLPALLAWLIADVRRRSPAERRPILLALVGGAAIVALSYVPLLASELQTEFHETRAAIDFLRGGGQSVDTGPIVRLVFVSLRVLAWPLTGLLTDALAVGVVAAIGVIAAAVWRWRAAIVPERPLARWIGATILWACVSLGLAIAGLATVTPLPVDHYHAFVDPLVFLIVGLGLAALWRLRPLPKRPVAEATEAPVEAPVDWVPSPRRTAVTPGRIASVVIVGLLLAWNVVHWPPAVAADGGYPAAAAASDRILAASGPGPMLVLSLPDFKTPEAYLFPLQRAGADAAMATPADVTSLGGKPGAVVVVCDALFVTDCGGSAEEVLVASIEAGGSGPLALADRFEAAPGRTISVYRVAPA
jgi:4-amino-4-deoxy-L-arabinose transferase-like glycosyltransferase